MLVCVFVILNNIIIVIIIPIPIMCIAILVVCSDGSHKKVYGKHALAPP